MQIVIILLLLVFTNASPQFQTQQSNPELDPVNDAAAQEEVKNLQQKRTLFGQGQYAYGPTKHIGVHPSGFKYLLGYGPMRYIPYAKPITYLKPVLHSQGWKPMLPHFKQVHFKPYFRRAKPHTHIVPVQHVEPHVHEVQPQIQPQVQPIAQPHIHIQPEIQQVQPHYHQVQPHFHQVQPHFHQVQSNFHVQPHFHQIQPQYQTIQPQFQTIQPQVHAVQPLVPVQPVQKPINPQQYYYPFFKPLNVPNNIVPQFIQPQAVPQVVPQIQPYIPQQPVYQQVPVQHIVPQVQHAVHQVPVQIQPNTVHQVPLHIHPNTVHQVPVQIQPNTVPDIAHEVHNVQVPIQPNLVHQVPVQPPIVHQVQPNEVPIQPNLVPNLSLNPALYHLLKQFHQIPNFKHITPLYPVNYPEQHQPPQQFPVTSNDAGVSVQIPSHLPDHPNYRPNIFPDQSGASDQDTTFPQPDFRNEQHGHSVLVHQPNVPTHPAPQTPLYLPPHPNFRPGAPNPETVIPGNSVQTELSATYPRQFPDNFRGGIHHPSISLEAPYGPDENVG